jgi:hypothetical protein
MFRVPMLLFTILGKSSMIARFVSHSFDVAAPATVGVEFHSKACHCCHLDAHTVSHTMMLLQMVASQKAKKGEVATN